MSTPGYRERIIEFIRVNAQPPDKFSHQERVYQTAQTLAAGRPYDDDSLFAAVWMHDLGVFVGHRPEDLKALAHWDHIAYAEAKSPAILRDLGFPEDKIPRVLEIMRTHLPSLKPVSFEGSLMRDADILDQLGAATVLRTVSKVGRDTRFKTYSDALKVLRKNQAELPTQLELPESRLAARHKVQALTDFLNAADEEADGITW